MPKRVLAAIAGATLSSGVLIAGVQPAARLPPELTKAIAYYATLTSYADTGTVTLETGALVDKARFTTYLRRASRDLLFDFQALTSVTVNTGFTIDMRRYHSVLWMIGGSMQTYQAATPQPLQQVGTEGGAQVRALSGLSSPSNGASIMITSLLYPLARLPSAILQIEEATVAGIEPIGGRPCHKVTGTAAAYYPNGRRTSVRPVIVWIDTETQLVRRVVEDTPEGYGDGKSIRRLTFDYQPQANPAIDDSKFQFTVPK
jgi:hypothetical protein